jgi:ribosomal protein S18 acetylase RimI-like enzyme
MATIANASTNSGSFTVQNDIFGFWRGGYREIYELISDLNKKSPVLVFGEMIQIIILQILRMMIVFYIRKEGRLVGMVTLIKNPAFSCRYITINDVIVRAQCREKGLGTALVDAAVAYVHSQESYQVVMLTSNSGNPERERAIKMYLDRGFKLSAESTSLEGTCLFILIRGKKP